MRVAGPAAEIEVDDLDRDPEVGAVALRLLHVLSRGDSLRQAIQAARPLNALQYICEHDVEQRADTLGGAAAAGFFDTNW